VFVHWANRDAAVLRDRPSPLAVPLADAALAVANAGVPVFSFDFGDPSVASGPTSGPSSWGNDNAIASFAAAAAFLSRGGAHDTFAIGPAAATGKFFIYAASMGALAALNYLVSLNAPAEHCAGIGLVIPVLDLDDVYQNDKAWARAELGAAYGVIYPAALPELDAHSPAAYGKTSLAKLTMPIKIWASSDDTVASPTASCRRWAAGVGPNVVVSDLGAVGHSAFSLGRTDPASFFVANL
jgi:hypothetical protein